MITFEGQNSQGSTHWKLHVPEEHAKPGLEVGIFATSTGLIIGGNLIEWAALDLACKIAKREAIRQKAEGTNDLFEKDIMRKERRLGARE